MFEMPFPAERGAFVIKNFRVNKAARAPAAGIFCAFPGIVHLQPVFRIRRISGIKRTVRAFQDVNIIVHSPMIAEKKPGPAGLPEERIVF